MSPKMLLNAALVAGSLFAAGTASATITINPGTIGSTFTGPYVTTGLDSNLTSNLTINSNGGSGIGFTETGTIDVTTFRNPAIINTGVGSQYKILGNFTYTGTGNWSASTFTANNGGSFVMNLGAYDITGTTLLKNLGVATLAPGPAVAFAVAFGSVAAGQSGSALTSLSALLNFTPVPAELNVGGFFAGSPVPFNIALSVGNAGGNSANTGYAVSAGGVVSFVTPIPGTNPGTANVTFVNAVPEPGMLSLAGIALLGLAAFSRRKAGAAA